MLEADRAHRELLDVRASVWLTTVVAVLSLGTGIANITVTAASGPLASFIPELVRQTAGFTGTLTGFLLLGSSRALGRGYRVGWYLSVLLLPITAVQGVIQASVVSLPLVVLSLLAMPAVVLNYSRFDRPVALSTAQLAATLALTGTLFYGTTGTFSFRDEFTDVSTLTDAFYYTLVTASTVGYGDMTPLTQRARLFSISLVALGTTSFAVALGSVLGPAIQARFSRTLGTMTGTEYDLFEDHVLVLGYGELTEPLVEELQGTTPFVVVTPDSDEARKLTERDIDVHVGSPCDETPLQDVAVEHARAIIVATNDDAQDAFTILTARELSTDVRIVAAATNRENIEKLERAGADEVLSPAVIGGHLLVRSAMEDDVVDGDYALDEHVRDE